MWQVDQPLDLTTEAGARPHPTEPSTANTQARHKAWIGTGSAKKGLMTWRPSPVHRVATKKLLKMIDNQFRHSTCLEKGLAFFQYDAEDPVWSKQNWREWPSVQFNLDLSSDNVCGYFACERKFMLNCDLMGDFCHGPNRDQLLGLDAAHLKQFMQVHK